MVPLYKTLPSESPVDPRVLGDYFDVAKPKSSETPKDVGLRLSNAVTWDLIGLSKWARADGAGGVDAGMRWLDIMEREVAAFVALGKAYT